MSERTVDPDLVEMIGTVFVHQHDTSSKVSGPLAVNRRLWSVLGEIGLTRLTEAEESGGSGATWRESAVLLSTAAANAALVPLAEHDLLAGYLLDTAGLRRDESIRTACVLDADGTASAVPWASGADRIVLLWNRNGWTVSDVPRQAVTVRPGTNLASEPRDRVSVDIGALDGAPVPDSVPEVLRFHGALARSLQICGAMERVLDICVEHTGARVQFGRPLAKFQAVQHMVAEIAAESSLARAAADNAVNAAVEFGWTDDRTVFAVASAKSATAHAATLVARKAHQTLGAIGFTMEHQLHRYTNCILSWRSEFGSVRYWDDILTDCAVAAGSQGVWELIEGRT
ncbi:acyl-CoA dehydrogenase [Rhodococcus opacus]|uniref:acyl-CoA dehydrogenase n=1 Tax=Rhodococcus opacus TaxID=37919 RepID=UPI001C493FF3|nr:acyl-CoA dehydrogenase [Rhodococcus opacus]MBV6756248.1 acyl-CoA dehydrogenase [Rhodococcus opacus]